MAEIFAAELGADPKLLGQFVNFGFHFKIAEGVSGLRSFGGQVIEIAGRGQLDGFHHHFGGGAADHNRQMIGRAGGGAQSQNFLFQKVDHPVMGEQGGRGLKQEGFIG